MSCFVNLALVHTSWTAPVIELLYRDLLIYNAENAVRLASTTAIRHLQHTRNMVIFGVAWIPEPETILGGCVNLVSLELRHVYGVRRTLFQRFPFKIQYPF